MHILSFRKCDCAICRTFEKCDHTVPLLKRATKKCDCTIALLKSATKHAIAQIAILKSVKKVRSHNRTFEKCENVRCAIAQPWILT